MYENASILGYLIAPSNGKKGTIHYSLNMLHSILAMVDLTKHLHLNSDWMILYFSPLGIPADGLYI